MRLPHLRVLLCSSLLLSLALTGTRARCDTPLLPNSSFEQTVGDQVSGWKAYERGYAVVRDIHHSGSASLRCANQTLPETRGASCFRALNQVDPAPVMVTGWSRAQAVGGSVNSDYALYVDLTYTDGTALWAQTAPFDVGTHDWQRRQVLIVPAKPLRDMTVYALFRGHVGTVWFDDFQAKQLSGGVLFDSQFLAPPTLPAGAACGWFARDVGRGSAILPLADETGKAASGARRLHLHLAPVRADAGGKLLQTALVNETKTPRAVTLYYVERFDAPDAVWWNDIRERMPARGGGERANLTRVSVGATGLMSLYPFGCVTGRHAGRTLGVPPSLGPRISRIAYHSGAHLFYIAFDLALTPRGDPAHHDRATVGVARCNTDSAWGFRDVAAKFYRLFPGSFRRRAGGEGIWMPFTDPSHIPHVADFGIAYHEGANSLAGDDRLGILSFRYTEPMTYWMPMPPNMPRTYENALQLVQKQSVGTDQTARRWAQAVLNSGSQDATGRFNVEFQNTPWANGAVWVLNPNPRLPRAPDQWTKARLNYSDEDAKKMYGSGATGIQDGEFLDSLEGWADYLDYRPESLRAARLPLTFATNSVRPALPTWFSVYEFANFLSADLHRRGKLLMANSTPARFAAFAPLLDVMGTETNWLPGGVWQPDSDAVFNLRRTLCYHKPYLLLQNTDFTKFGSAQVEKYFARCLFYGVYPSMFSADAATHAYWEDPRLYNRDRPLFQKYIPLIRRLSAAGWEPVTYARSESSSVFLERFGTEYLTVLNSSNTPVTTSAIIDLHRFHPAGHPNSTDVVTIRDALSGSVIATAHTGETVYVPLRLLPGETRVLDVHIT